MLKDEPETSKEISVMLQNFDSGSPIRDYRNIIEHAHQYIIGDGNKSDYYDKSGVQAMSFDGDNFIWFGTPINMDTMLRSAEILYTEFLQIVKRWSLS
jgi:hypothetical protein